MTTEHNFSNSFELIASKLPQTLLTLFEKHNFSWDDCIRVFISSFFRRPIFSFNPFKIFCLPFKSCFIVENTCFCGLCVYKRIVLKGLRKRTRAFRPAILYSNYTRSNEQTRSDFASCGIHFKKFHSFLTFSRISHATEDLINFNRLIDLILQNCLLKFCLRYN